MSIFSFFKRKKQISVTKKSGGKPFRRDIQALRAFAVAAVVLYHLWPNRMIGGFTGVDIFFVISGYLMTLSVMRQLQPLADKRNINVKSVTNLLVEFYARRIKRLVPAALATILGVLGLAQLTGNLNVIITNAQNAISAATFWQNWFLANDALNYLQQDNQIVATQHFWSLSVEEQFYLMWPLLLIICTLLTVNITVFFKKKKIPGLILPLILVTLGSLAYGVWITNTNAGVAYYSTPARIWEMMVGGIIALLPAIKNYDLKLLMPYAGLVLNFFSIFFIGTEGFPGWWALVPVIGTAMIIWGGVDRYESKLSFDNMFRWRPIQWIGNISYSFYLWHFPLIILVPILIHQDIDGPHGRLIKVSILIVSLLLAQLSYTFIEETTRKVRLKTRYIYLLFVVATGLVAGGSYVLQHHSTKQVNERLNRIHIAARDIDNKCFGARAITNTDICGNPYGVLDKNNMNAIKQDNPRLLIDSGRLCYAFNMADANNPEKILPNKSCTFGDATSEKKIILMGDSHSVMHINAFDYIGKKLGYKIKLYDFIKCDYFSQMSGPCKERFDYLMSATRIGSDTVIVLSYLNRGYDRLKDFIETVQESTDNRLLFLKDNAHSTPEKYINCYTLNIDCELPRSVSIDDVSDVYDKLVHNSVIKNDDIIDITDLYCDHQKCYTSIGGVLVLRDTSYTGTPYYNSHITPTYSLTMGPELMERFQEKVISP